MDINKIFSYPSSLEIIAKYIIDNFDKASFKKQVKVILPSYYACRELKELLTSKYRITNNLPAIIPFTNIISIIEDNPDIITSLEERLILTKIVTDYSELKFSLNDSLKAANFLSELFNNLIIHNTDIKLIKTYNNSKYWQKIYQFLEYTFNKWQEKITEIGKQTRANHKLFLLQKEITKINNNNQKIIIAGIFKPDPFFKKFIENCQSPSLQKSSFTWIDFTRHCETLKEGCGNLSQFTSSDCHVGYLRNLLAMTSYTTTPPALRNDFLNRITYFEPENIFEEGEKIALICKENIDKKIAIIINNYSDCEIYRAALNKYSINFQNFLGENLHKTNVFSLITSTIKILCNNFDLKTLFILLKNPLINSLETQELELLFSNQHRFTFSHKSMVRIVEMHGNEELATYLQEIIEILFASHCSSILEILNTTLLVVKKLYSNIWQEEGGTESLEFINNLIGYSKYILLNNLKDFPNFFSSLSANLKYYKENNLNNIIISSPSDLALSKFDLVILPGFNNNNWPPHEAIHPWLSTQAQEQLNIDLIENSLIYSQYLHAFLQNPQIAILRAKKIQSGVTVPSNFWLKLQLNNPQLHCSELINLQKNSVDYFSFYPNKDGIRSPFFPNTLSVTDIELLIKSPYSFYAKKILNLRQKDKIWEEPKISDFGSFIHKVLEQYSKNYENFITKSKQELLINIGDQILQNIILPFYTKKTWQTKLSFVIDEFINFDELRRKNCQNIYSELKGELKLNIVGQDIKITGIADRIEIDKTGHITILDYKTGTIPLKKEIESGLSPQLIIESLMMKERGFNINFLNLNPNITIAYVKISSTEPYIQTTEIKLSTDDLNNHKQGLISFLEHYVTHKFFPYDLDLSQYNDYLHLKR